MYSRRRIVQPSAVGGRIDPEVRPHLETLTTTLQKMTLLGANRFTRFATWIDLVMGMSKLITFVSKYHLGKVHAWRESIERTFVVN